MAASKGRLLFYGQMLLLVAFLMPIEFYSFSAPSWLRIVVAILGIAGIILAAIAIFQLMGFISVFPEPVKGGKLITTGAFKISRHPIYTGILLATFGYSIFHHSGYKFAVFLFLCIWLNYKASYEEKLLQKAYSNYAEYKKKTGRFLPKIRS